jgi:apolipoprotein N-acyltransferase
MDIIGVWFGFTIVALGVMCIYWYGISVFVKIKWLKIIIMGLMTIGSLLMILYRINLIH